MYTELNYFEKAKFIWKTFVPRSGQADTVQGEMLRASEKLRDEAQRNGNINFNENCHSLLIAYLRKYLSDPRLFYDTLIDQINTDLDRLSESNHPYLEDDIYDRINDRIVDWFDKNPEGLHHHENPDLYC